MLPQLSAPDNPNCSSATVQSPGSDHAKREKPHKLRHLDGLPIGLGGKKHGRNLSVIMSQALFSNVDFLQRGFRATTVIFSDAKNYGQICRQTRIAAAQSSRRARPKTGRRERVDQNRIYSPQSNRRARHGPQCLQTSK